jgi:transposase
VRSERQSVEQLDYNLLFRWFVGAEVNQQAKRFMSDEHFTRRRHPDPGMDLGGET